jgi:hypothetical protein
MDDRAELGLEELRRERLEDHCEKFRMRADLFGFNRQRRLDVALRVLLALKRAPGADPFEAEDRFVAWCVGFGIPADECWDEFTNILQRRKSRG